MTISALRASSQSRSPARARARARPDSTERRSAQPDDVVEAKTARADVHAKSPAWTRARLESFGDERTGQARLASVQNVARGASIPPQAP